MIIRILLGLLLALLAVVAWQRGSMSIAQRSADSAAVARERAIAERDAAQEQLRQANGVIAAERRNAVAANAVAAQFEKEMTDAQAASDRVVAGLRAGNQRLHQRWQAAIATGELSAAAAAASSVDGGADDRYQSAGRAVGAADACDAQVRGLQAFARLCAAGGAQ